MDEENVKESRLLLRRIQDHIFQAHTAFGVEHETLNFVDVIHHPANNLPDLNYVTPRRNTAWVSAKYIQQGLDRLAALGRESRVQYIEGLYPPPFAKILRGLGLQAERETPFMVYSLAGVNKVVPPPLPKPTAPIGVRLEVVTDQTGVEMWWYVWRNAYYDVFTLGVEPLAVGRDMAAHRLGQEIDVLMYRHNLPVGVARLSIQQSLKSAHIVALALLREARTPQLMKLLLVAAMRAALARSANLIFAPGENEEDRALDRELGFIDIGSMVCYAARSENVYEVQKHDVLAQPVLALRR